MEDPKMYREKYKEANDKDILDILLPDWDKKKKHLPLKVKKYYIQSKKFVTSTIYYSEVLDFMDQVVFIQVQELY